MTNEIPKGGAKGGYARAARLSQDQRSAIASEAARTRWRNHRLPDDAPRVLEGFKSELNLAGVKIPCAVISGPKGIQRVLTENGITYAILGERSGASKRLKKAASEGGPLLPLFVAPSQLKPFISKELEDGPSNPSTIKTATGSFGATTPPRLSWSATSGSARGRQELSRHNNCRRRKRPSFSQGHWRRRGLWRLSMRRQAMRRSDPKMPSSAISKSWFGRNSPPGPRNIPMSSTRTSTGSRAGHGRAWARTLQRRGLLHPRPRL
jgi:hypothetical protein